MGTNTHAPSNATGPAALALQRRIEEASLNAWPALVQLLYDGWIFRFSHGFTRRANAVTPLSDGGFRSTEAKIRWCENQYARAGQPSLFRLPGFLELDELETALAERGYAEEEATCVLSAALAEAPDAAARVRLTDRTPWLRVYAELTGEPDGARRLHDLVLRGIAGDCLFTVVEEDGQAVACGLGVVEDDLLGIFDVVTAERARRQGHGRTLIAGLHARGHRAGARTAYLQMRAGNEPAAALYEDFGYGERYRYRYLRKA